MRNEYRVPWHIRQYVKAELMDYRVNLRLVRECEGTTRSILVAHKRLEAIGRVLDGLCKEDKEVEEIIFDKHMTQVGAEVNKNISKATYYRTMNKVIWLVAKELELI